MFSRKNFNHFTLELNAIEKMSFQSTSENRSDFLRKLVPGRGGCDDEGAIANVRTSGSWNQSNNQSRNF